MNERQIVDCDGASLRNMNEDIVINDSQINPTEHDELHRRSLRKVYLITYSQADLNRFPTRRSFANAVLASFASYASANVLHWCCSQENHREGGKRYHMALKFDGNQRWLSSKRYLEENDGISVHFSAVHHNYYSAWRYVTKEDKDVIESQSHPDLWNSNSPKTTVASLANKQRARKATKESIDMDNATQNNADSLNETASEDELTASSSSNSREGKFEKGKKRKRISAFELSDIVVKKGIKSRTELLVLAKEQKDEGKTDIAEFIVNRGAKVVAEVLETAWEMENAKEKYSRAQKSRMELLMEAKTLNCNEGCGGEWLRCAEEILHNNGIILSSFQQSVIELLTKGRGKYRNIMIVGPANCGKTFLLNPLTKIFVTFSNPASTTFAWVDAEKAECLFLNDFRWSQAIIPWHDLLLLLEGQLVHLPAPKTHYAKDICFSKDTPIFATGKNPIMYVKNGSIDERETDDGCALENISV